MTAYINDPDATDFKKPKRDDFNIHDVSTKTNEIPDEDVVELEKDSIHRLSSGIDLCISDVDKADLNVLSIKTYEKDDEITAHSLDIVKYPDKRLSKICKKIDVIDDDIKQLILDMYMTMRTNDAVGIAAPQVGQLIRLIVIHVTEPLVLINPTIFEKSSELIKINEGCLSIPKYHQDVNRANKITVIYTDVSGELNQITATGLHAAVIQHEIDHIDGKTMLDHLPFSERLKIKFRLRSRR